MAANAPLPTMGASWTDSQSTSRIDTQGLEIGMSGLNLVMPSGRPPALSGSSFSTAADDPASRQHSFGSMSLPSADHFHGGIKGSPPPPGSPQLQKYMYQNSFQSLPKPPGLGGFSVPSPIGKNSTANNTLSSSPNLTLTPSSSVDGNTELYGGFAIQDSPFPIETSAQMDSAEGRLSRSPWSDFGHGFGHEGFVGGGALDSDPDDGLRGLGALRDRAHSSPGPISAGLLSTSPPVRIDFSAHQGDLSPLYSEMDSRLRAQPRKTRTPRESIGARHSSRPPLSGGGGLSQSPFNFEGNNVDTSRFSAIGLSHADLSGVPRPELKYSTSDNSGGHGGHNRSRSAGGIGGEHVARPHDLHRGTPFESFVQHQQHQLLDQSHTHKFGTLPNLNAHIQQQQQHRIPLHAQQNVLPPQNRHIRSYSHSGALQQHSVYSQETYEEKSLGRSYDGRPQQSYIPKSDVLFPGNNLSALHSQRNGFGVTASSTNNLSQPPGMMQRSTSMSQPSLLSHLDNTLGGPQLQRRNTDVNQGGFLGFGGQHGVQSQQPHYHQIHEDINQTISQPNLSTHVDNSIGGSQLQRRNSDSNQGGFATYGIQHGNQGQLPQYQQKRHEFHQTYRHDDGTAPVIATPDEMRLFNMSVPSHERSNSFGHSRSQSPHHHQNISLDGRYFGDYSRSLSSSPMSMDGVQRHQRGGSYIVSHSHSTGGLPHYQNISQRGQYGMQDEDLTHPLAGEHINDPSDVNGLSGIGMSISMMHQSSGHSTFNHGPSLNFNRHVAASIDRSPMSMNPYGQADLMHHHMGGSSQSPRPAVYNVKFKRTQRTFIVGPRIRGELKMGCYVKVEADRGEDLGIIVGKVQSEKANVPGRPNYRSHIPSTSGLPGDMGMLGPTGDMGAGGVTDLKRITRLATHDEVGLLNVKREEEEELLKICRTKCRQRALPMTVIDAEYQFDRHKLTFFFEAEGRIDFRELVRDLFSMYKTRIWMQQLDKNCGGVIGSGPMSAPPGGSEYGAALGSMAQLVDYPTEPVFAPASEMGAFGGTSYH